MAEERLYTIPLRKEILKVQRYKRAKKAVSATREYLVRHCKADDIILGNELNEKIHERGRQNPPVRLKVKVYKFKDRLVANLVDAPMLKEEEKKKSVGEKLKDKVTGKKEEPTAQEEKKEEEKKILEEPQEKRERRTREGEHHKKVAGEKKGKKELFPKDEKPKHVKKK